VRAEAFPTHTHRPHHTRAGAESPSREHGATGAHREAPDPAGGLPRNLLGLTVVVVDDDEASLEYFAVALRTCGADVLTASTAVEGLQLVEQARPHVVLSDIAMVGHDGYWLVREIRQYAEGARRRVPVVATTAYGREHSRERILAAGFTEHLPKPVDPELLCRIIGNAAGRTTR
jgi:hypothetical protein